MEQWCIPWSSTPLILGSFARAHPPSPSPRNATLSRVRRPTARLIPSGHERTRISQFGNYVVAAKSSYQGRLERANR